MHFLVPAFLAGLLAVGIPVAMHLIGRQRARVVPFAALDFLLASRKRVARRLRLRRILLLSARVGTVVAIPLILSKPYRETAGPAASVAAGPQSAVVILDDSFGMQYRLDGETVFAHAQEKAAQIITDIGADSEVAVLLTARMAGLPGSPDLPVLDSGRGRALQAIQEAHATYRADDVGGALQRAAQVLANAPHRERDVYLVSNLRAHTLAPGLLADLASGGGGPPPILHLVDATGGRDMPNLAVVSARTEAAPDLGANGVRVIARVANYSDRPVAEVPLTLEVDGKDLARGFLTMPAHGTEEKRFELDLPPGVHAAAVVLPGDALAADDRRWFRIVTRREIRTLVVDGDPRTERREDEVFYLTAALAPGIAGQGDAALAPTVTTIDALRQRSLTEFDVLILANVKELPPEEVTTLDDFVRRGGGLFWGMGDNVDPDLYNRELADLLPMPLGPVHSAGGAGAEGPAALSEGGERLGRIDLRAAIFSVFPRDAASLRSARFDRYVLLAPEPDTAERRTLAWYEDGAPALVEETVGKGKILLFTSTLDRDWTDLPIQPGYLPLVQQAVRDLANAPLQEPEPPVFVGHACTVPLHGGEQALTVTPPLGRPISLGQGALSGRKAIAFTATDAPGIYRVASRTGSDPDLVDRPDDLFAVNTDPAESDTTRASDALLDALSRGGGGRLEPPPPRREPLWSGVAVALLMLLLVEGLLTFRA